MRFLPNSQSPPRYAITRAKKLARQPNPTHQKGAALAKLDKDNGRLLGGRPSRLSATLAGNTPLNLAFFKASLSPQNKQDLFFFSLVSVSLFQYCPCFDNIYLGRTREETGNCVDMAAATTGDVDLGHPQFESHKWAEPFVCGCHASFESKEKNIHH
jgi:hypothetical protein